MNWRHFHKLSSVLILLVLVVSALPIVAAQQVEGTGKVEALVLQELDAQGKTDYFVWMTEQADVSYADQLTTKLAKGTYVYQTLVATAERTQKSLRSYLDVQGVAYRPYYVVNAILIEGGSYNLLMDLAGRPDVAQITANHQFQLEEPIKGPDQGQIEAVEPNITFVKAPDVWTMGFSGQGTVMAGNDTGLDWDHPAIINKYRGWNGSVADHNYNWWDATGAYPTVPGDGHGHGTHTTGTMVGDDGAGNQIGMAPGAQTVHCKNMTDGGSGSDSTFLTCFEWDLAPWDLNHANPLPAMAPDAINNSWGYGGGGQGQFRTAINNLQAAGVAVEVSAGNEGSGCGSLRSPGDYHEVLTTGSVNHTSAFPGSMTGFSSRGPSSLDGNYFPDITAPGENIRSSVPGGGYQGGWSGTSMSGPHATALIGLLWSACPAFQGMVEETYFIITSTAVPVTSYVGSCGGDYSTGPNNDWGYGTIDALAAVNAIVGMCGPTGTLEGHVTDASTSAPIEGALVVAGSRSDTTDATGYYEITFLPEGTYSATASAYGYLPDTDTGIDIVSGTVTTHDFALQPVVSYVVDGVVYDENTGWPLYASIDIAGYPDNPIWSDPETGYYSVLLPGGSSYDFTVNAWVPGYLESADTIGPLNGPLTVDWPLAVDVQACAAPGYHPDFFWYENFENGDGGFAASGTTSWAYGQPTSGPGEAHSGAYVWATNPAGDYGNSEDGYATSPNIDLSSLAGQSIYLSWWQYLVSESGYDYASVEVSNNGGASWTVVYGPLSGSIDPAWANRFVILDSSYAVANFQVRFHFLSDGSVVNPGWYIDDIGINGVAPGTVVYNQDFEANNGSYVVAGTAPSWAWGAPTSGPGAAHSGANAWATNLGGNYNTSEDSTITSPNIDLSAYAGNTPTVKWWQWLQTESCCDYAEVRVSNDGGSIWTTVWGPTYGGAAQWEQSYAILDPSYAVANFQVQFHFYSDYSVEYPGWYVDDIVVEISAGAGAVPCLPPANGGLVVGNVFDENTGLPLNGAQVTNDVGGIATTVAVPDDPNNPGGFYTLYTPNGVGVKRVSPIVVPESLPAQANPGLTVSGPGSEPVVAPEVPANPEAVLWDQPASDPVTAYVDQQFPDFTTFSAYLADDFVVSGDGWDITNIFVPGNGWNGFTTLLNATALHWEIYADNGGVPAGNPEGGGALWSLTLPPNDAQVVITTGGGGYPSNTMLNLADSFALPAGSYWFVFYPTMAFSPYGQYGRNPAGSSNNGVGQFINPGGGFGYGSAWQDWRILGHTAYDQAFRLEGNIVVLEPHTFTATLDMYGPDVTATIVPNYETIRVDFELPAGWLEVTPNSIHVTLDMGANTTVPLDLNNLGGLPVAFELREIDRGYGPLGQAAAPKPAASVVNPPDDRPVSIGRAPNAPQYVPGAGGQIMNPAPAYAIDVYPGYNLVSFDTETPGTWNIIANLPGTEYFGGDFLNGDFSTLYAVEYGLNQLHAIDTTSGAVTVIGPAVPGGGESWTGLAGSPDGTLYGSATTCSNSTLYTVDPATGAATAVGPITNGPCIIDIAVNAAGEMYGVDIVADVLVQIDPATGAGTVIGPLGVGANYAQGMDFDEEGDTLYWAAYTSAGELRTIDVTTGASTLIGPFSGGAEVDCFAVATGGGGDVPWLFEEIISGTIAPVTNLVDTITFDAGVPEVTQPGNYYATLKVANDTPYGSSNVVVTMTVLPLASYGKLDGTVSGLGHCDGDPAPLEGATVVVEGFSGMTWTLTTDAAGYYSAWIDEAESPLVVTAMADVHTTVEVTGVVIVGTQTTTVNMDLRWLQPCVTIDPPSMAVTLAPGDSMVLPLNLINNGAAGTPFELMERPATVLAGSPFVPVNVAGQGINPGLTTVSPLARPVSVPAANPEDVLWDQPLSSVNQNAYVDQDFPDSPDYSSFLADDFVNDSPWIIESIFIPGNGWNGFTTLMNADSLNWQIYADNGGVPDGDPSGGGNPPVWSLSLAPNDPQVLITNGSGGMPSDTLLTLATPGMLEPGHYWLVFYPSMGFSSGGQYGRQPAETVNGYVAQFINPGGGFGFGPNWQAWSVIGPTENDIAFRIEGTVGSMDIPWLSESPVTGTIAADDTTVVDVTFDSITLTVGTYTGTLVIRTDDPTNPSIEMPVQLTISECDPVTGADFVWAPAEPQEGEPVAFTATVAGGAEPVAYAWDLGDGTTSSGANVAHAYAVSGTYTVVMTASNYCSSEVVTYDITVVAAPPVCYDVQIITYTANVNGCAVDFTVELTGTAPFTYLWSFGDGMTSTLAMPAHTYAASGVYNGTIEVWNCTAGYDTLDFQVTVSCGPTMYYVYLPVIVKTTAP